MLLMLFHILTYDVIDRMKLYQMLLFSLEGKITPKLPASVKPYKNNKKQISFKYIFMKRRKI